MLLLKERTALRSGIVAIALTSMAPPSGSQPNAEGRSGESLHQALRVVETFTKGRTISLRPICRLAIVPKAKPTKPEDPRGIKCE